jgi:hypothetical protein
VAEGAFLNRGSRAEQSRERKRKESGSSAVGRGVQPEAGVGSGGGSHHRRIYFRFFYFHFPRLRLAFLNRRRLCIMLVFRSKVSRGQSALTHTAVQHYSYFRRSRVLPNTRRLIICFLRVRNQKCLCTYNCFWLSRCIK